jgi:hypothetical protein
MSYLDELKQVAEKKKSEELSQQQKEQEQEEKFRVTVRPALRCIHQYFMELVKHLNYVKPIVSMSYQVEGLGEMYNLQQSNYRISGYTERGDECSFSFDSVGQHSFRILKNTELEMKSLKKELWKHNIQHTCSEQLNDAYKLEKAAFVIKPFVQVRFHFRADFDTMNIDLYMKNFNRLEERIFTVKPCEVNQKFLDELTKFILKQPNTLRLNNKYQLPTEQRMALRAEVDKKDREEFDEWLKSKDNQRDNQEDKKQNLTELLKVGLFERLRFFGKK